jgi:hypothetical protein
MNDDREQWIRDHPARALDTLSRRLERAANAMPAVVEHLIEQRASISILNAHPTDSSAAHGSDISNPTLALVTRYDEFSRQQTAIVDGIITAWVCVDMLDTECRNALGMRAPSTETVPTPDEPDYRPAPRCIGDNTADGAVCWNIPSPRRIDGTEIDDGRCHECGPRHDAIRRAASDARRLRRQVESL